MAAKPGASRAGGSGAPTNYLAANGFPTKDEVLAFVRGADATVGKRDIIKAFAIKGPDRARLKALLQDMADEGLLTGNRKGLHEKGGLPAVCVIVVTGRDSDGDLIAQPVAWEAGEGPPPRILLDDTRPAARPTSSRKGRTRETAIGEGDRVLARLKRVTPAASSSKPAAADAIAYEATPIKRLPREGRRMLGIYRAHDRGGGEILPVDRKQLKSFLVREGDDADARDGDLVRFELAKAARHSLPRVTIVERLGNPQDQRLVSLIAVHAHGIPDTFPARVLDALDDLTPPRLDQRRDLRDLPLITIDPADARDHDDAVYAAPDEDPANEGGVVVWVAIADVAHYVRPGDPLDREAQKRGNSVYFPDRVVPMLPERISNDLCSLRENEERPCLAVRMTFDKHGEKRDHAFHRGLMRSHAKLAYEEAQAAIDGRPNDKAAPLLDTVLRPLWDAYAVLSKGRANREPLDLDLPERKIIMDAEGGVDRIVVPERLEAHKLIEEFMIQANVAAAQALEARKTPVVYRIHDQPSKDKLKALKDFLETLDLKLAANGPLKPAAFNAILRRAQALPSGDLVNEVVLRSQAQAEYNPSNVGHFGLNLRRYAHFTSPIRRYADLLVHRALIKAYKLGPDGLQDDEAQALAETAQSISNAERRAMAAERETIDRLIASHLADHVGARFAGRVSGVTGSGLFIKLSETGADGFIPISTLGDEYFDHDEEQRALVGERTGTMFQLGDQVEVRLQEALPTAGALRFEMLSEGKRARPSLQKGFNKGRRGTKPKARQHGPRRRR
ncbi:MAG: ribonuclease R [Pseudomonadota bacterium]